MISQSNIWFFRVALILNDRNDHNEIDIMNMFLSNVLLKTQVLQKVNKTIFFCGVVNVCWHWSLKCQKSIMFKKDWLKKLDKKHFHLLKQQLLRRIEILICINSDDQLMQDTSISTYSENCILSTINGQCSLGCIYPCRCLCTAKDSFERICDKETKISCKKTKQKTRVIT